MHSLKEIGIALARIILGLFIVAEILVIANLIMYISVTSSTSDEVVSAAYFNSYDKGYSKTYDIGYQEAYEEAYDKGFTKAFEIKMENVFKEGLATRVEYRNPTYQELREFLSQDKTDSNPFISGEYVCFDFAAELNNNADVNGIRSAYVRIRCEEWAHAVVAFETVDRGLIFIEPQSDKEVELIVGRPYPWQLSGAYRSSRYNDPIVEIQILW